MAGGKLKRVISGLEDVLGLELDDLAVKGAKSARRAVKRTPKLEKAPPLAAKAEKPLAIQGQKNTPAPGGKSSKQKIAAVPASQELPIATDPQGIIAYHGSPHSFDRFDISKIGTGEGAQAYGHGLYFAEAEPVAQEYRQRLAEVTAAPFDEIGIPPREWNAATMFARQMDPSQPEVAARDFAQWVGRQVTPELVDAFRVAKKPGNMYKVRLNVRPEDLLDWDAAFTPESLESFAAKFDRVNPATRQRLEDWSYVSQKRGLPMPEGSDVMQQLGEGRVSSPELSRMLNEAGILGVQYLDQASRSVGDGTRNYVMFNDDTIDLLRKYAVGGAAKRNRNK